MLKTFSRSAALSFCAGVVAILGRETAHAKAHELAGYAAVEGVITVVEATDNPGDTDYNFIVRPVQSGDPYYPTAFPNVPVSLPGSTMKVVKTDLLDTFWVNGNAMGYFEEWVKQRLNADLETVKKAGNWSDQCKACAGTGPGGTACWLMTTGSCSGGDCPIMFPAGPTHPCRKLFGCRECLYDILRLGGEDTEYMDNLSHYTPKAEIFIGSNAECTADYSWCNDMNPALKKVMKGLGVKVGAEDIGEGVENLNFGCKELSWNGERGAVLEVEAR